MIRINALMGIHLAVHPGPRSISVIIIISQTCIIVASILPHKLRPGSGIGGIVIDMFMA